MRQLIQLDLDEPFVEAPRDPVLEGARRWLRCEADDAAEDALDDEMPGHPLRGRVATLTVFEARMSDGREHYLPAHPAHPLCRLRTSDEATFEGLDRLLRLLLRLGGHLSKFEVKTGRFARGVCADPDAFPTSTNEEDGIPVWGDDGSYGSIIEDRTAPKTTRVHSLLNLDRLGSRIEWTFEYGSARLLLRHDETAAAEVVRIANATRGAPRTGEECSICCEELRLDVISCVLPCGHAFHEPCIQRWVGPPGLRETCPNCRAAAPREPSMWISTRGVLIVSEGAPSGGDDWPDSLRPALDGPRFDEAFPVLVSELEQEGKLAVGCLGGAEQPGRAEAMMVMEGGRLTVPCQSDSAHGRAAASSSAASPAASMIDDALGSLSQKVLRANGEGETGEGARRTRQRRPRATFSMAAALPRLSAFVLSRGVLEVREARGGFAVELKQYEWRHGMSTLLWRSPLAFRRRREGSDGAPTCDLHHALMQAERHLWREEQEQAVVHGVD